MTEPNTPCFSCRGGFFAKKPSIALGHELNGHGGAAASFSGRLGWLRRGARIWDFSSTATTAVWAGELTQRPKTLRSFSSKAVSVERLS